MTVDHKTYILNQLSRAIESTAESKAKTQSPKAWKALKEQAPAWPIYDAARLDSDVLMAWDVAKRVAIDSIVKELVSLTALDGKVIAAIVNEATPKPTKAVTDV
jgi:hypothetical protein